MAVIGPVSPPSHGHMVFTERILASSRLNREFEIVHVDVSDHRDLENIGRLDPTNVILAFRHIGRLLAVLLRRRPALVYVPLAQNKLGLGRDLVFVALALIGSARVLPHVHGGGFGDFLASAPAWFRVPALALLRRCDAIVVMSEWQRERVARCLAEVPLEVVPHGTDTVENGDRELNSGPLRALYVSSSLQESKGIVTLLEAASAAQRAGLTDRWEVIGPWLREAERRKGEAVADGVDGIDFRGGLEREELERSYRSADVFVFPTHASEGFGLVRIEAMAAGLPVITTEAGGAAEIVRDGVDGYIVDYERPDEIVRRIEELRDDPGRRAEMGRQARERQRALFSAEAFEESLARVWGIVLRR